MQVGGTWGSCHCGSQDGATRWCLRLCGENATYLCARYAAGNVTRVVGGIMGCVAFERSC